MIGGGSRWWWSTTASKPAYFNTSENFVFAFQLSLPFSPNPVLELHHTIKKASTLSFVSSLSST